MHTAPGACLLQHAPGTVCILNMLTSHDKRNQLTLLIIGDNGQNQYCKELPLYILVPVSQF